MEYNEFDVVVVGAGHAGCEAALACARMGCRTLMLALNLDSLALMPCNPSIGGTGKGHLVREVDALGGEMGRAIDDTFLQSRMLNTGKGPAVHSLRAQADKRAYQARMRRAIDAQENLTLRQGEASGLCVEHGKICGVETLAGGKIRCRAAILACGVYLKSRIIIGDCAWQGGPQGLVNASALSESLKSLGFELRRFKTGTPARLDGRTVDFDRMEPQYGDEPIVPFSFMTDGVDSQGRPLINRFPCFLTYTTPETHEIIRRNLHRAPMYRGDIHGTGARYCPSIEDKVVRFADKERHPIFLEPEGADTIEWYAQGMSTSMPEEVQLEIYHSVPGLEHAELMRLAYAIEYDCIDPTTLKANFCAREIENLFFAGQINGTSGYEEAAAQGLYAGMNAVLALRGEAPMLLTRADAYLGVLVDDLTTKGTDEPYRMMTSRAEYRLSLRQDNADLRLTEIGHRVGLADDARYARMLSKRAETEALICALEAKHLPADARVCELLAQKGEPTPTASSFCAADLVRRPAIGIRDLTFGMPTLAGASAAALEQAEISLKYDGYLKRQAQEIERFRRAESNLIPEDLDYSAMDSLRIEARQKLAARRPRSLGQAARIPGVSPGDISVLMIMLERMRRERRGI